MHKDRVLMLGFKEWVLHEIIWSGLTMFFMTAAFILLYIIYNEIVLIIFDVVIAAMLIFGFIFSATCIQKYIDFTDETVTEKSIFGKIKKEEKISCLVTFEIKGLSYGAGNRRPDRFYCLYFRGYLGEFKEHYVNQCLKNPHIIAFMLTKQSTEILKKYLPEEWHVFLDKPKKKKNHEK